MEVGGPLPIIIFLALCLLPFALYYLPRQSHRDTSSPKKITATNMLPPSLPLSYILAGLARLWWPWGPSLSDINHFLHQLHASRGSITALLLPFATAIFISDAAMAHQVLVNNGAAVSERLPPSSLLRNQGLDRARLTLIAYGEAWRSLRRNLVSGYSTPSSMEQFADARHWAKKKLLDLFRSEATESAGVVNFRKKFLFVSYSLLAAMCFGRKLNDKDIVELQVAIESSISASARSIFFSFLPYKVQAMLSKLQSNVSMNGILTDLLRARRDLHSFCYADSLFQLELPANEDGDENRKLREEEIVELCAEFFGASGHNTSIALEWIMAELVNHRDVQEKLAEELSLAIKGGEEVGGMHKRVPYLRAVVMEGLRLHPPSPSFIRYAVKQFEVGGYVVPKGAVVFFNAAAMGVDEKLWDRPLEFRPERFLEAGDAAKVMAFGEGRRECAGSGLAMLHLSYFVAHLVREFEWKPVEGDKVDMSEKTEYFRQLKIPLRARIASRNNKIYI